MERVDIQEVMVEEYGCEVENEEREMEEENVEEGAEDLGGEVLEALAGGWASWRVYFEDLELFESHDVSQVGER